MMPHNETLSSTISYLCHFVMNDIKHYEYFCLVGFSPGKF